MTTVGFWNEIAGDWRNGSWLTAEGNVASDVGGTLFAILMNRSISWRPILRSNAVNLHPVFYGLYEGQSTITDPDSALLLRGRTRTMFPWRKTRTISIGRRERTGNPFGSYDLVMPKELARLALDSVRSRRLNAYIRKETRRSDEIYEQICSDPEFFRQFEADGVARRNQSVTSDQTITKPKPATGVDKRSSPNSLTIPCARSSQVAWEGWGGQ